MVYASNMDNIERCSPKKRERERGRERREISELAKTIECDWNSEKAILQ